MHVGGTTQGFIVNMVSTAIASSKETCAGDLVLRIRGTSRHGQVIRLHAEKCTIGSGPRCTLRLRARGVRPLHCLIVRGPAAAVIRRWHPDTRLNGRAFTESLLSPGDRLSVGPLEFEVLEALGLGKPSESVDVPPAGLEEEDIAGDSTGQVSPLAAKGKALDEERRKWETERAAAEKALAAQTKRLETLQAELTAARQALEQQTDQWQAKQAEAEKRLQAQQAELAAARQAFQEQCDRWNAARAKAEEDLKARQQSLDNQRQQQATQEADDSAQSRVRLEEQAAREAEFEARQRAFEELRQRWEIERSNSETQLHTRREELKVQEAECKARQRTLEEQRERQEAQRAEAEERLNARQAQLEALQHSLEEQRKRQEAERAEAEEKLNARQAELEAQRQALEEQRTQQEAQWEEREQELLDRRESLEAREADLEAARNAFEEERHRWEAERAKAARCEPGDRRDEPSQGRPSSSQSPLSSLEVLRRMGNLPEYEEEDEEFPDTGQVAAKSPGGHGRETSPGSAHGDHEEESIDDYMARLLERVRGVTGEAAGAVGASPKRRDEDAPPRETIPFRPADETAAQRFAGKRREPVEMSPRAVAPEKFVNLTAMREVANLSAQTAIDRHSQRLLRRVVGFKLLVAVLGLVSGIVLLGIWRVAPSGLTFSAAMISLVVGLFWGIQFFVLMIPRIQSRRRAPAPVEPPGEESSPDEAPATVAELLHAELTPPNATGPECDA